MEQSVFLASKRISTIQRLALVLAFFALGVVARAAIFTVNHAGDEPDGDLGDGTCDTGNAFSGYTGLCSLRAAIENAGPSDQIIFTPSVTKIEPLTPLPAVKTSITGGALTPSVEISGVKMTWENVSGLVVVQPGVTISTIAVNGFSLAGISLQGSSTVRLDNVHVTGCYVGLNLAGTEAIPNGSNGIVIEWADSLSGATNSVLIDHCVISGNLGSGISLPTRLGVAVSTEVLITDNIIGLNAVGDKAVPNGGSGVFMGNPIVNGVTDCDIENNVISGNLGSGILDSRGDQNRFRFNRIGTDITGTFAIGNFESGITLTAADNELIEGNLISGNYLDGVRIQGYPNSNSAVGNIVKGNLIGTDHTGLAPLPPDYENLDDLPPGYPPFGNGGAGIGIYTWSLNSIIGAGPTDPLTCMPCNTIAFNGGAGVAVVDSIQNGQHSIRGNAIYGNGVGDSAAPSLNMGIDLGNDGPTPNDLNDADFGANHLQNKPVIQSIVFDGTNSIITLRLDADINTPHMLDFYESIPASATGYGDARTYLGSQSVTFAQQASPIVVSFPGNHKSVSVTATDNVGNTSEFSTCGPSLTVNSNRDLSDNNPGDGLCSTGNTITDGRPECTLRAAIQEANATAGLQTVLFDLLQSNWGANYNKITPATSLPMIQESLAIDATSQPGYSFGSLMVELNGGSIATPFSSGLKLTAQGCSVRGMAIYSFNFDGVVISGPGSNVVQSCMLGTNPQDVSGSGNDYGVRIVNSPENLVGGTSSALRNIISGNSVHNVLIEGNGANSNKIYGNYIGTSKDGQTAVKPTTTTGVRIEGSSSNRIGTSAPNSGNVISGQTKGVHVIGPNASLNVIMGNLIGTDSNGTGLIGNTDSGVILQEAQFCNVGGSSSVMRNVISGNERGIEIINTTADGGHRISGNIVGLDKNAQFSIPNVIYGINLLSNGNFVGGATDSPGTSRGNIISGNLGNGILVTGERNVIAGNIIGSNHLDDPTLLNGGNGIRITGRENIIGGGQSSERNVISNNSESGIFIIGTEASDNQIRGNFIGTTVAGSDVLPNTHNGVAISDGAQGNYVGGSGPGHGNLISGNLEYGVAIYTSDGSTDAAFGNFVLGNTIGLDINHAGALPNGGGILITNSYLNEIGYTLPSGQFSNTIAANYEWGIAIQGGGSYENFVLCNEVGILSPINAGNAFGGIALVDCDDTTVDGNHVVANAAQGIRISGPAGAPGFGHHLIFNNLIRGNGETNDPPGQGYGIHIVNSNGNRIGPGNTIDQNYAGGIGISQSQPPSSANRITRNSIDSNYYGLGIDLNVDGPTANDELDPDSGPNDLINAPILSSAFGVPMAFVQGIYQGKPNQIVTLEFFHSPAGDSSGFGEGKVYFGSMTYTTDAQGDWPFFFGTAAVPPWQYVSATATTEASGTSEFSNSLWVGDGGAFQVDFGDAPDPDYPTLVASEGARHMMAWENPIMLGSLIDSEFDGFPSAGADGDDLDQTDDEDGVTVLDPFVTGANSDIEVVASAQAKLDVWLDHNLDGDWDDAGEKVFDSVNLTTGTNTLQLMVSHDALGGATPMRFRMSTAGGLNPSGPALDGEVEDYIFTVSGPNGGPTVKMIERYLLKLDSDPTGLDANGDGVVDVADIVHVLRSVP